PTSYRSPLPLHDALPIFAFRVVAFSTLWAVLALVVIATIISALFRQASERGFESLLTAHLFNLISSVGVDESGRLSGAPNLGDLDRKSTRLNSSHVKISY